MKFAIICIVMLVCAQATLMERYPINFSSKRSIMNLMVQVDAHIKAGGPMDAITNILDEFEQGIKDEQVKHNELHAENQASCAEELAFRENAVREAEGAIKEAQQTLDGCVAQLNRAESDLKASENQLANARSALGTLERERIQNHEIYAKNEVAYKALLNGIDEALEIIAQLQTGNASFVQIAKHTNKMMLMAAQTKSVNSLAGVMAALVQVQNKDANTDAIFTKLNGLFSGFKNDVQNKYNASIDLENSQVQHYNTSKARLTSTINKLNDQIANLQTEILALRQCISVQQSLLSSAKGKLARNSNLLKTATSLCNADVVSYEQQTAARRDELELLVAIKAKVHERYAQIKNDNGTITRGQMSKEQIDNSYNNASAYNKQSFQG